MPHKYWYCGTFDFKKVSKTRYPEAFLKGVFGGLGAHTFRNPVFTNA